MMTSADLIRIRNNPAFQELVSKRSSFGWSLAALMFGVYMVFILLVAFARGVVAQPFDGVITVAFPLGLGVIVLAIVLTGVYVIRANSEFDRLTRQIVGQVETPAMPVDASLIGGVR